MSDRIELTLAKAAAAPDPAPQPPAVDEPEREEAPANDARRLLARLTRDMRLADAELDRVHQAAEGLADHHRAAADKLRPHLMDLHAGPTADEYGDHLRDAFEADVLANDGEYLDRLAAHATLAKADQPGLFPGLVPERKIVRRKSGKVHTQTYHVRPDEPTPPPAIRGLLGPDRYAILDVERDSDGTRVRYALKGTEAWPTTTAGTLPRRYDPAIARENEDGTFALQPGWSFTVPPTDDRLMYRGMSWEEWQEARATGVIRSRGDLNALDGQEGYTCFAHDIRTAATYATTFAPAKYRPAVGKPGVLIAVPREAGTHLPHQSSNEVNIEAVPVDRVQHVWEAHPYAAGANGTSLMEWDNARMGVTSAGGDSDPGESYAWRDATPAAPREHYPTVPAEDDWRPQRMTQPTRLYRSVSLAEAADILTRGSIRGGGNTFNPFDTRRHVFFGAAPSPAVLGSGEDVRRQVEYAMRDSPLAERVDDAWRAKRDAQRAYADEVAQAWKRQNARRKKEGLTPRVIQDHPDVTPDNLIDADTYVVHEVARMTGAALGAERTRKALFAAEERYREVQSRYVDVIHATTEHLTAALAQAPFTSVTLRTRPVTGGLEYKPDAKGEGSGMPGESEFAFPPDAITLDDLEGAYLVRRPRPSADAEIVREVTLDELREALRAFGVPTAHALTKDTAA